jgi:hypothetical protein
VRYVVVKESHSVRVGEVFTIQEQYKYVCSVKFENYNELRHECDGDVPYGHGWFVDTSFITECCKPLVEGPIDLEELM